VLVEDSVDDAEQLVSALRNGGIAVRPSRMEDPEKLLQHLKTQPTDLVIANVKSKAVPFPQVGDAVLQSGKDVALVALLSNVNEESYLSAQADGAHAIALRSRPEHVLATVKRTFEALVTRRSVRRLEASIKESERRCDALLDSSRDPICFVHEGAHVRANRAYLEMFGFEEFDEIAGMPLMDMVAPEAAEEFKQVLRRVSKGEPPPSKLQLRAQKSTGGTFDAVMDIASATFEGEPCLQITFRRNFGVATEELEKLRSQDLVTGLYNRQFLLAELDEAVTRAASGKDDMAFLMLEPDNLKVLVDSIGIGNMDLLLADMAQLLREQLKPEDVAARFSDTSFAVLLRGLAHDQAQLRAEQLRRSFEDRIFEVAKKSLTVNVSVGMVLIGERIANADAILGHGASTLKAGQGKGGNRVESYDPAAQDKADAQGERNRLAEVQHALKHAGFILYFQPIISLQGVEGEYYEILLRMQATDGEEVLPAGFFPVAERNNLLSAIDRWVVANAIKQLSEREKAGHKSTFFLKLSPASLDDATLLPWIAQHLKAHRLRGDALVFEMPESKVVTHLKPVRQFQKGLEQLHCAFALEQFGNGLNSFQLLKHVDAKYLKVDRTFMAELPRNKENQAKVKEICTQAAALEKITVAEFVEDAASMSILFSCGVDFVQGNFLQEPEKVMSYEFV
jgi:diguanylate cyclase (GGDEF)-like protein/PAS domain S-box-containing protein